jgi:DinB family protein
MKLAACTTLLLAVTPLMSAQTAKESPNTANPITTTVRTMEQRFSKNLTGAADEMPADKYSYKPTPDQITFAHLMAHTAEANYAFCAAASGDTAKKEKVSETDTKDVLSKAVKDSFSYCEGALGKADDSTLGQTVTLFDNQTTRGAALIRMAAAWSDHYAAAAMYLRLNNLLPPSAAKLK